MKMTSSFHVAPFTNHKANINWEHRKTLEHVNVDKVEENVVLFNIYSGDKTVERECIKEELRNVYVIKEGSLISIQQLLKEHNTNKRSDRLIDVDTLMEKRNKKGEYQLKEYEMIIQVGNRDDEKEIGDEYFFQYTDDVKCNILEDVYHDIEERFEGRMIITQAVIHMDETTPHLHLSYVPCLFDEEKKRGLQITFSQDKFAKSCLDKELIKELKEESKSTIEFNRKCYKEFHDSFQEIISKHTLSHGVETVNPKLENCFHQNQNIYREAVKKAEEILDNSKSVIENLKIENKLLRKEIEELNKENELLKKEIKSIKNEKEHLIKENESLKAEVNIYNNIH